MRKLLILFFTILSGYFVIAQKTINFTSDQELIWIGKKVTFLEDKTGKLTIKNILKTENQKKFQTTADFLFHKPISSSVYWLKFTVNNQSTQDIWLALDRSIILSLELYTQNDKNNFQKVVQTGALYPFESRPYPIISGFWLPLNKAKESKNKTYYVRITSHFGLDIPLQIATLSKLHQQKTKLDILSAGFIGLMLIMVLYNSFLFFSTKDKIYLSYTVYLISITFTATFLNSYPINEYFTFYHLQPFWHHYFSIWTYPTLIFSALFCIQYLELKINLPKAERIIKWILLSQLLVIFVNLTGLTSMVVLTILEQVVPITLYSTCLVIAIYLFFIKKLPQAKFYLLGWSFFFIGLILLVLSGNGLIPFNMYIRNASYFGIALEVWMFSLALGERMKLLQKQNEAIQTKNLKIVQEQKAILEKGIKKRTRELEEQQEILEDNNIKLKANEGVLKKSHGKLKDTLEKNKAYLKQIQQQKEELQSNNEELQAKEEELRQNFEELQSTQDILEKQQIQLKRTLARNKSITRALNESAIISITNLQGNILQVNEIFCKTSGYTEQELVGKNQNIVNSGHHPQEFWKRMWKIIGTGHTWRGEVKNKAKDGSFYWVDAVINPLYDENDKIYSYLSIRYLITQKKEAAEKIKLQNVKILRKNRKIAKIIDTISNFAKKKEALGGNWQMIAQEAMQAGVEILRVNTCELWYYNFKQIQMYRVGHYSKDEPASSQINSSKDNPLMFRVLDKKIMLTINDIENDERLSEDEKIHFLSKGYKAAILYPVFLSKNQTGVLVCLHTKLHTWESEDVIFLKSINDEFNFAFQAFRRAEAKRRIEEQSEKIIKINENLNASIQYAQRIQKAFLVNQNSIKEAIPNSFIFFKPRDIVSGDFYFYAQKEYKAVIAAVDCTGHGIPGAFMSLIGNNLLSEIVNVKAITKPDRILDLLRKGIIRALKQEETNNQDGMDIAICAIEQYPEEFYQEIGVPHLEYAGVGNPLIYFQDNEMSRIKPDKMIIGGFKNYLPDETFTLHRIPLDKPTTFYIFSDGIQDQFGGEDKKKFTPRRLRNLLQEIHHKDIQKQKDIVSEMVQDWQKVGNQNQIDDMLLIGVKL